MDRVVNCSAAACAEIEITLERLEGVKKALEEKRGDNSRTLRFFLTIIYLVGLFACAFWALRYNEISLVAGASSALFLAILLVRNLIEAKYYNTIYIGERNVTRISHHLQKVKSECSNYYGLLSNSNSVIDYTMELGENLDSIIESTEKQVESLEKGKSKIVGRLLPFIYYVAAISVGTFLVSCIQNVFKATLSDMITGFGADLETASFWASGIYAICAILGVIGGPIFTKYYFERIKLVLLKDSLIFLIAGSGAVGFIVAVIAAGLIAGVINVIKLIPNVIGWVFYNLPMIIGIIIIIAIIVRLFKLI